jgi:hypothetical protein
VGAGLRDQFARDCEIPSFSFFDRVLGKAKPDQHKIYMCTTILDALGEFANEVKALPENSNGASILFSIPISEAERERMKPTHPPISSDTMKYWLSLRNSQ